MFNQPKLKKITRAILIIFTVGMNQKLIANECDHYREEIEYYQHLRGIGGNADEMNRWTAIGHDLEDKYYRCSRNTDINPTMETASGEKPTSEPVRVKRGHSPMRGSSSNDSQLQSLIKTCNYWIEASNENLTQDNINFRDTACRAVDNYNQNNELGSTNSSPQPQAVRTLKDCIKPKNLIDSDVNACMQGNLEPRWKK